MPGPLKDVFIRIRSQFDATGVAQANRQMQSLEGSIARVGQASGILSVRSGQAFAAFVAATAGAAKVFADVQTQEINLRRVTNLQGDSFKKTAEAVKGLSRGLGLSREEALALGVQASKLGIEGSELATFVKTAAQAAQALGQESAVTADQLGKLRAALRITIPELNKLTGAVVGLDNVSAATFPDILDVMLRVGPAARIIGLAGQDLAAVSATLLEVGITSQVAGTALQKIFSNLTSRAGEIAPLLGLSATDLLAKSPIDQLKLLSQAFVAARQSPEQFANILKALGLHGSRADVVLSVLGNNLGRLDELMKTSSKEFQRGTLLARLFGAAATALAFAWKQFKNDVLAAAEVIGRQLAPAMKLLLGIVGGLARAIRDSPVLQMVAAFTLLAGTIATVTTFITFFTIANLVAFKVVKDGLAPVLVRWGLLTKEVNAATGAVTRYRLAEAFTMGGLFRRATSRVIPSTAGPLGFIPGRDVASRGFLPLLLNVGSLFRTIFSFAGRLFLPVTIFLGAIVAIKDNLFGVRDALVRMVRPFKDIFGSEGQGGMKNLQSLLKSLTQFFGYLVGGPLRVLAEVIRFGIVEPLAFIIKTLDVILGPIADLLSVISGSGKTQFNSTRGSLPSVTALQSNALGGRDINVTFTNPQIRSNEDLKEMERIAKRAVKEGLGRPS